MEPLTQQEWEALASIRAKNYAVVVFNPEEIRNAAPNRIQDALVESGWEIIHALNSEDNQATPQDRPTQRRELASRGIKTQAWRQS
jgi:hypothetical protein